MALFQKLYRVNASQFVPITIEEAWAFFSSPDNLQKISPDSVGFEITSKTGDDMYPGMLITYIVSPVLGIKMRWCTEITQVKDKEYFVDDQRFGPYAFWHHQHHFEEVDGGVLIKDIVHYGIPLGPIGQLANALFVRKQIREIFDYRVAAVERLWPGSHPDHPASVEIL